MLDEIKLGIIIALIAIVGFFAYNYVERGKEIKTLNAAAAVKDEAIAAANKTISLMKKSDAITETVINDTKVKEDKIVVVQDKIKSKVDRKVDVIDDAFDKLPKTPDNDAQKAYQVSEARIDGLWESYCAGVPDVPECKDVNTTKRVEDETKIQSN